MKQSQVMLDIGGDSWLERNRIELGKRDPIIDHIGFIEGSSILEIGCSTGWRLTRIRELFKCDVHGIDPSKVAIEEARQANIDAVVGTADNLPWADNSFGSVILGFCMWMIDPTDWFKVVSETDRVLANGGHLIIHDYMSSRGMKKHCGYFDEKLRDTDAHAYFYNWPILWTSHPGYKVLREYLISVHAEMVCVVKKDYTNALYELIPADIE